MSTRSFRPWLAATAALALLLATPLTVAKPTVVAGNLDVHVAAGTIQGRRMQVDGTTLRVFQGVPYAAPPVGKLRWRPPQPVAHWQGVRKTQHFGPRCMQRPVFSDMKFRSDGMSEDCLYLNVWTPAHSAGRKLPVLVYFFGGGFIAGDGSEYRYDGASLAAKGIVTVTVNYRLGIFGFMTLPALVAESSHHAAGNYGLLDQNAALRWVKTNIAQFGGDPSQVTIGGESAGSISVSAQMASPLSKHLFARAIGESGALIAPIAPIPLAEAEKRDTAFVKRLGVTSLAALRKMPAKKLLDATGNQWGPPFDPDIDGWFLTEPLVATFRKGGQAQVPLLVGSNSQEGYYPQILKDKAPTPANYRAALKHLFGDRADRALALYPGKTEAQVKRSATALASDMFIAHSTWRWMDWHYRTGHAPVYYYYFTKGRPAKRQPALGEKPTPGAVHSGEIEYALGNLSTNKVYAWTPADYRVSRIMESYFARFIKTGNPNGKGLLHWPAVRAEQGGLLRQVIGVHTHTKVDRQAERQHFLTRFFADHPGET